MDLLFTGAAASLATGIGQGFMTPAMGNIPNVPQGSFDTIPSMPTSWQSGFSNTGVPMPPGLPVYTADNQWFGAQVGQVINSITGINIGGTSPVFIGMPEPFPYDPPSPPYTYNPFPGYTANPLPASNFDPYAAPPTTPNPYFSAFFNGGMSSFYGGLGAAFMFM